MLPGESEREWRKGEEASRGSCQGKVQPQGAPKVKGMGLAAMLEQAQADHTFRNSCLSRQCRGGFSSPGGPLKKASCLGSGAQGSLEDSMQM